jgi:hypothetical protein
MTQLGSEKDCKKIWGDTHLQAKGGFQRNNPNTRAHILSLQNCKKQYICYLNHAAHGT